MTDITTGFLLTWLLLLSPDLRNFINAETKRACIGGSIDLTCQADGRIVVTDIHYGRGSGGCTRKSDEICGGPGPSFHPCTGLRACLWKVANKDIQACGRADYMVVTYNCAKVSKITDICTHGAQSLPPSEGYIASPRYPTDLPGQAAHCAVNIQNQPQAVLQLYVYDVGKSECHGALSITEGDSHRTPSVRIRLCTNNLEGKSKLIYKSRSARLRVTYTHSGAGVGSKGFLLYYNVTSSRSPHQRTRLGPTTAVALTWTQKRQYPTTSPTATPYRTKVKPPNPNPTLPGGQRTTNSQKTRTRPTSGTTLTKSSTKGSTFPESKPTLGSTLPQTPAEIFQSFTTFLRTSGTTAKATLFIENKDHVTTIANAITTGAPPTHVFIPIIIEADETGENNIMPPTIKPKYPSGKPKSKEYDKSMKNKQQESENSHTMRPSTFIMAVDGEGSQLSPTQRVEATTIDSGPEYPKLINNSARSLHNSSLLSREGPRLAGQWAAIVGGVIGSIAVILLLVIIAIMIWEKRKRKSARTQIYDEVMFGERPPGPPPGPAPISTHSTQQKPVSPQLRPGMYENVQTHKGVLFDFLTRWQHQPVPLPEADGNDGTTSGVVVVTPGGNAKKHYQNADVVDGNGLNGDDGNGKKGKNAGDKQNKTGGNRLNSKRELYDDVCIGQNPSVGGVALPPRPGSKSYKGNASTNMNGNSLTTIISGPMPLHSPRPIPAQRTSLSLKRPDAPTVHVDDTYCEVGESATHRTHYGTQSEHPAKEGPTPPIRNSSRQMTKPPGEKPPIKPKPKALLRGWFGKSKKGVEETPPEQPPADVVMVDNDVYESEVLSRH